jgi:hypothetical protein
LAKWFLGTYTSRFNRRHKLFGHLFSGRYKSLLVDGSGSGYLKSVCDYVRLNPARAKLLSADAPLKSFAWSSWLAYLLAPSKRPAWLRVDRLLGENGIPKDSPAGRQRLERAFRVRRGLRIVARAHVNACEVFLEIPITEITCTLLAWICKGLIINGVGEWNRTLVIITKFKMRVRQYLNRLRLGSPNLYRYRRVFRP